MVIEVDGKRVTKVNRLRDFVQNHRDTLEREAEAFHATPELKVPKDTPRVLYLFQREFAVLKLEEDTIPAIVGSDEATTCHLTVLLSRRKRILAFGHVDGAGTLRFLGDVLRLFRDLGDDLSQGVNAYLVGGFLDDHGDSARLSAELLDGLARSTTLFHLRLAAITEFNSELRPDSNLHFPRRYGLAVNTRASRDSDELSILPALFEVSGPWQELRSTRFCSKDEMVNVYNARRNLLELPPMDYTPLRHLDVLVMAPDHVLRRYSTSPDQEKEGYEQRMRSTLKFMLKHPRPRQQIFKAGALRFHLDPRSGDWEAVE